MAEMLQELQELETQFFEIRGKLRHLKGKVRLFQSVEHKSSSDCISIKSANDLVAYDMLTTISYALMKLDQYDYQRDYWFERESSLEKLTQMHEFQSEFHKDLKSLPKISK